MFITNYLTWNMKILAHRFSLVVFIIMVSFAFLFTGCNIKKNAVGMEDIIYVVADSTEFYELESTLLQIFGKVIYTPQPENLFSLKRVSVNKLGLAQDKKNVIVIAPLNSGSYTSNYLNSIIDSTVKEMVAENSEFVFNKRDLWAKNQLVMILTSPTMEQLKHNLLLDTDNLLYQFQEISNARLLKGLYNAKFEQPKIEAQLLKDYGWIIYVQTDFAIAKDSPEESFVWMRSPPGKAMERWVFVHWVENASPDMLNSDYIYENRNRITDRFFRTTDDSAFVLIADNYLTTKEVNFNDKYALMTQGLWRMSDGTMGGPFLSYTYFDEETSRLYMLDASIYAPKYLKKSLIQQLDVVLRSFKTEAELSEDRIEDLLSYID